MNPEFNRIQQIFQEACAIAEPAARQAYLDKACKTEAELRRQVEALLFSHENVGEFLKRSVVPSLTESLTEAAGTVIGKYKLLQEIGEGGFGVVFMAEQLEPVQRKVALKVLKPGMDTREVIARFEAERQALALMDHPNVARVLDGGTTASGRPYFVMDLVKGTPITDFCDQNKLSPKERLTLFLQVCTGVQHAHQKGIIHRDLKPTNVLVTVQDGLPLVKVIDFGIAKAIGQKLTEKTLFTRFEQLLGTPAYMSPEQAQWSTGDVDTRSDIYSLGVLLYELLTGTTPLEKETLARAAFDEVRRTIREVDPPAPSTRLQALGPRMTLVAQYRQTEPLQLARLVHGELDWIVMRALDKDRARRYQTANGLSQDVKNYLQYEPITAGPPSRVYVARKFVRRHRAAVGGATILATVLLLGLGVALFGLNRARQESARAKSQAEAAQANADESRRNELAARENLYAADISQIQHALAADNLRQARELLQKQIPKPGEPDLRGFEWRYLWQQCQSDELFSLPGHEGKAICLAFSPDGKSLATAGENRQDYLRSQSGDSQASRTTIKIWDVATRRAKTTLAAPMDDVLNISFSPNGQFLATGSRRTVCIWDVKMLHQVAFFPDNSAIASFSPAGDYLVTASTNGLILRDSRTWKALSTLKSWKVAPDPFPCDFHLTFSPDGTRVGVTSDEGVKFYAIPSFQEVGILKDRFPGVRYLAFSPDGQTLAASTTPDKTAKLWDVAKQRELRSLVGHSDCIVGAAFSPDGKQVATASSDQTVKLWSVATGELLRTYKGHVQEVWGVMFSPDGKLLTSIGKDGSVKVWDASSNHSRASDLNGFAMLGFNSQGNLVAAATNNFFASFDPQSMEMLSCQEFGGRKEKRPFTCWFSSANLFSDGRTVAFSVNRSVSKSPRPEWLEVWDLDRRKFLCQPTGMQYYSRLDYSQVNARLAYAPRRRLLATCASNETVSLCEVPGGATAGVLTNATVPAAFAPDETLLATCNLRTEVMDLWRVTGQLRQHLLTLDCDEGLAVFSPDSRMLAVGGDDSVIRLYAVPSGRCLATFIGHKRANIVLSFSPDGRTLASADFFGTVRLWHVASGRELLRFQIPVEDMYRHSLAFSPDGRSLAGWRDDPHGGLTRLWFAPTLAEIAVAEGQEYRSLAQDAATWHAVGKALVKRDRLEEAVSAFSETVQKSTGKEDLESIRTSALRQRSRVFRRLGRFSESAADNCAALNIPARDPHTSLTCVDLSAYYNGSLDRDWFYQSIPFYEPFPTLPRGCQTLPGSPGVKFDLRGVVQLSKDAAPPGFPDRVDGIAVSQKCRHLHFLHATYDGEREHAQIGAYVIHFAGGGREEIPIRYGEDVRGWVPADGEHPAEKIAWTGQSSRFSTIRLFHEQWENPHPELEIESLDFISKQTKSAPFLVAITAE